MNEVAWSSDGRKLVAGLGWAPQQSERDNSVRIWDSYTGELLSVLQAGLTLSVDWSPDGTLLATGTAEVRDATVRIWDAATGELRARLRGHTDFLHTVAWSPDGRQLLTAAEDQTVRIWDIDISQSIDAVRDPDVLLKHTNSVPSLAWSPDGAFLASGGEGVHIWDTSSGEPIALLDSGFGGVHSVSWNPQHNLVASGDDDNTIRIWDVNTGDTLYALVGHGQTLNPGGGAPTGVASVAWSPNGELLASGGFDGTVRIWQPGNVQTGQLLYTFEANGGIVASIAWSPDGQQVAAANGGVNVWDVTIGEHITYQGCNALCYTVSWSSGGILLAGDTEYDIATLIESTETGILVDTLSTDATHIDYAAWNPDDSIFAMSQNATVRIWNMDVNEPIALLQANSDITALAWSPDGHLLAGADSSGIIHIWGQE